MRVDVYSSLEYKSAYCVESLENRQWTLITFPVISPQRIQSNADHYWFDHVPQTTIAFWNCTWMHQNTYKRHNKKHFTITEDSDLHVNFIVVFRTKQIYQSERKGKPSEKTWGTVFDLNLNFGSKTVQNDTNFKHELMI